MPAKKAAVKKVAPVKEAGGTKRESAKRAAEQEPTPREPEVWRFDQGYPKP